MADDKRKKAPDDGPDGIDRFSSNGYGLELDGKKVDPVREEMEEIEEIEET